MPAPVALRALPDPVDALRSNWLDSRRLTALLAICLSLNALAFWMLLRGTDGLHDSAGRLLGGDFAALWGAGVAATQGAATEAYTIGWFNAHLRALFAQDALRFTFSYPPIFFAVVAPLGLIPYGAALAVWLGGSLAAMAVAVRRILPHPLVWLAVLAFPGVYGNAVQGQTGFLAGALFAAALLCVDRAPVCAGLFLAALAFKPQFGVLAPLALMAGGHWRVVMSASAFLIFFGLASVVLLGVGPWYGFIYELGVAQSLILAEGRASYYISASVYGALRQYGAPVWLSYAGHTLVVLAATAVMASAWLKRVSFELRAVLLICGSMLATPYCFDYDLAMLGPAIAFMVSYGLRQGFGPWEHTGLTFAFLTPPLSRLIMFLTGLPLGLLATAVVFVLAAVRAGQEMSLPAARGGSLPAEGV